MNPVYEKLVSCKNSIEKKTSFQPKVAIVLGSGLGGFAEEIEITDIVNYDEIEGFPISTAPGHKGRYVFGYIGKVSVVIMQGRVHYYEGYDMSDVVLPIRLMGMLGAEKLFLTNASGGINGSFRVGDFMMITDHISCFVPSPLVGENMEELGVRFPDMTQIYNKELQNILRESAEELKIELKEGVYLQTTGPNYETPAEIRMFRTFGADAVGMSTACEAMAAHHMGMKVCGISCISNMASGITEKQLDENDVIEEGKKTAPLFKKLVTAAVEKLA